MHNVGRAFFYTSAVFGFFTFGACSPSEDAGRPLYGGGQNGGAAGAMGGAAGGLGAIGGEGGNSGTIGGLGGNNGSSSGGSAGTGPQPALINNCPGSLDANMAQQLQAGGTADPSMKWLYPYDQTIFPRGILPPILQWAPAGGTPPQAVYVHIKSANFEYHGCFGATNPARIALPGDVWAAVTEKASGIQDPVNVEITTAASGRVSGPIKEVWAISPATLKGAIYYNTYGSPQAAGNGAIMRIVPGQQTPQVYMTEPGIAPLGPCKSCHSLSANGQSMVLARHMYTPLLATYESFSYDVASNPNPNPPPISTTPLDAAGFAAVYPDGSRFMTMGSPGQTLPTDLFPYGPGSVVGMEGPRTSRLFQMDGTPINAPGWNVQYAKMPMFSPDGTKIVFNHHDTGAGRTLAMMDFNKDTNTFSNLVQIYSHPSLYAGWPFFTPDSKGVIFVLGEAPDYVSAHPFRPVPVHSELYYVDVATRQAVRLSRAGGFNGNTSYMPYPGRDEGWEYFPTVSPVAAGGYFWLFFTSRRNYGNIRVTPDANPVETKQIWATAIDIEPPPGQDPSHPAFYLPGQEEGAGNVRAFAALEPCKDEGQQCSSGVDCCCGKCSDQGACQCNVPRCSKLEEACTMDADCCDAPRARCIGGYCTIIAF